MLESAPDYQTDWRWLKDCQDSPWYPGIARLFRQARMGERGNTVNNLAAALAKRVEK